jgi:AraC-like DNA-binding protein
LRELLGVSRALGEGPAWWTPENGYFAGLETRTDPSRYYFDGMERLDEGDDPIFFFQFTLAGWGHLELEAGEPERMDAGAAFFAMLPSKHRYYLPRGSPGWTFGWIGVYQPYFVQRVMRQVATSGPVLRLEPDSKLFASAMRLVRGAFKKDYRDRFDVELALFEFVVEYERLAHELSDSEPERAKLLETLRRRIMENPTQAFRVEALAAEQGMSRSHFSHFFRALTGLTPARFVNDVRIQEASRLLSSSQAPLKRIAEACGFSSVNHFCKVFRRFKHITPEAYRRSVAR